MLSGFGLNLKGSISAPLLKHEKVKVIKKKTSCEEVQSKQSCEL